MGQTITDFDRQCAADFRDLRDRICARFEALEDQLVSGPHKDLAPGRFERKTWVRDHHDSSQQADTGGGEMSIMRGRVFEKVGVNISTVHGHFSPDFRTKIPGAMESDGQFWAAGISLVAHMRSPLVPAVHMNLRRIVTSKGWFGGGADLTPMLPDPENAGLFHAALKECCDSHGADYYERFKKWADDYFYIKHRQEARGAGGIFYDYIDTGDQLADQRFSRAVGETFLKIYPQLVENSMHKTWTQDQRDQQLVKRGRYVEFNLLYDRGTIFGLQTGGNVEAILMSLPPEVRWP